MLIEAIDRALDAGKICSESHTNLRRWLSNQAFQDYWPEIERMINANLWKELDDSFYRIIEFGTGGRRGPRGVGPNRINLRTIGESAQGLADYIHEVGTPAKGVVVAFDSRHMSREFASEISRILAANKIPVFLYREPRSTPQLSFSIRQLQTQAGCMISASHNPPQDNGIKVSWADGGQILPPHDTGIIQKVLKVDVIKTTDFENALLNGNIRLLNDDMDAEYLKNLQSLSLSDNRSARIAYSPLHGVGTTNVVKLLTSLGFDLVTVPEQMRPDPDFTTVKNHLPNPELPDAMEQVTALAQHTNAAVAMASDPDADRLGATIPCPVFADPSGWLFLNGNQIGALLLEHVLRRLKARNDLPIGATVIKTIVTTELLDAICATYHTDVIKDLLVGFKYIAEVINQLPPDKHMVFATEESHGYNRGLFVRDKDSAPAAMHLAELACDLAAQNKTIYSHLNDMYRQYGYFYEGTKSVYYPGKSGLEIMLNLMESLRQKPPTQIAGTPVFRVIDRKTNQIKDPLTSKVIGSVNQHTGNVMIFHFDESGRNRVTARPSGTEPKIKFYAQLWEPIPPDIDDLNLERIKSEMCERAAKIIQAVSTPGEK